MLGSDAAVAVLLPIFECPTRFTGIAPESHLIPGRQLSRWRGISESRTLYDSRRFVIESLAWTFVSTARSAVSIFLLRKEARE